VGAGGGGHQGVDARAGTDSSPERGGDAGTGALLLAKVLEEAGLPPGALNVADDTEYGLSSAVFTRDEARGARFALQVQAGMTHINDAPGNDDPNTAFGGEKQSGIGRFGGRWPIEELTTDHWVTVQREPRRYPI
jgi:acyl-CoA reductase-like NAD-dependent aldehyde dehydrogenase